jgi:hypothetical protein
MSREPSIKERLFQVDGKNIRCVSGIADDGKSVELLIDSNEVLTSLDVAKVLEVLIDGICKDIKPRRASYAGNLN